MSAIFSSNIVSAFSFFASYWTFTLSSLSLAVYSDFSSLVCAAFWSFSFGLFFSLQCLCSEVSNLLINPFVEFSIAGVIFIISESTLSLSFKSLTLYFIFHISWKYCQFCIWFILNCGSYYFNIWKLKSSISAQISAQFYSWRRVSSDIFWVLTMCILLTKVLFN